MKINSIKARVEETQSRLTPEKLAELRQKRGKKPLDLVNPEKLARRRERLAEADFRPSPRDRERILGTNDLVDVNYLARAQLAAKSVCRIILRDAQGRELGFGSGFKVAPNVLMTNHHVLETAAQAATAIAEFGYELDISGRPSPATRFPLNPRALFFNDEPLDFAIVAIEATPFYGTAALDSFGFLRMQPDTGKVNEGEFLTIIQHPSGLPKQIALRENQLLSIEENVLWYESDTAPGSSGSAVLNDSWQIVAIHHSGIPRKNGDGDWLRRDGQVAGPDTDDSEIDWVANEGIRISRIVGSIRRGAGDNALVRQLDQAVSGEIASDAAVATSADVHVDGSSRAQSGPFRQSVEPIPGGSRITVPFSFDVRFTDGVPSLVTTGTATGAQPRVSTSPVSAIAALASAAELKKTPILDNTYGDRKGYDPDFLGVSVPFPTVTDGARVSKLENGKHEIPYQHFTVVMDKLRRMALYAASNVDASLAARRPEAGKVYTRDALGGFGENDREQWVTDPRIPEDHQLPDEFYNDDRQAFDKGHLVRREDVCFGSSYRQVQRANGDTYHTTNCTPQVLDFNRSGKGGIWGQLENEILKQAKTERYCLFAGPLLRKNDRAFEGSDLRGPVRVQIPSAFWKIVIARNGNTLEAFAFLLEQDLSDVQFREEEFAVSAKWKREMISIAKLEQRIGGLRFPQEVRDADQFGEVRAEEVARATGFRLEKARTDGEGTAAAPNGGE